MFKQHSQAAQGRWQQFNPLEQMANIGSEVFRYITWKNKDPQIAELAFFRALELFSLTKEDPKNKPRLKELCRLNEALCGWYYHDDPYQTNSNYWQDLFYNFTYAAKNKS